MCDETESFETVALSPHSQRGEIDVCGEVLLAGSSVEVFVGTVIGVSEDCAGHVVRIEQVGGFVTVVNGENKPAIETTSDFGDPVAGFETGFGVLSILERDLLSGEILGDGAGGERQGKFSEARAIASDENFAEGVLLLKDTVNGQRVEEFVGKEASDRNASWNFDGW